MNATTSVLGPDVRIGDTFCGRGDGDHQPVGTVTHVGTFVNGEADVYLDIKNVARAYLGDNR